jgi:hypothetical protein
MAAGRFRLVSNLVATIHLNRLTHDYTTAREEAVLRSAGTRGVDTRGVAREPSSHACGT